MTDVKQTGAERLEQVREALTWTGGVPPALGDGVAALSRLEKEEG